MKKKGLWIVAVLGIVIVGAIILLKDGRDMEVVEKEQLENAADSADSKLDELNATFDDMDFDESELEDATVAFDTI